MNTKVALEYDDFSPRNSNLSLIEEMKEHYPGFKITLFTVPWEIRFGEPTPITDAAFVPWVNALKEHADWIELALHGMTHAPREWENVSYDEATKWIIVAEKMFENRGLKLAKVFKAPQWLLSEEGERALQDRGYKVVKDHYYNWNLKDEFPQEAADRGDLVIGHGHVQDECGNGMAETFHKIMKLPVTTEFFKISEII